MHEISLGIQTRQHAIFLEWQHHKSGEQTEIRTSSSSSSSVQISTTPTFPSSDDTKTVISSQLTHQPHVSSSYAGLVLQFVYEIETATTIQNLRDRSLAIRDKIDQKLMAKIISEIEYRSLNYILSKKFASVRNRLRISETYSTIQQTDQSDIYTTAELQQTSESQLFKTSESCKSLPRKHHQQAENVNSSSYFSTVFSMKLLHDVWVGPQPSSQLEQSNVTCND